MSNIVNLMLINELLCENPRSIRNDLINPPKSSGEMVRQSIWEGGAGLDLTREIAVFQNLAVVVFWYRL